MMKKMSLKMKKEILRNFSFHITHEARTETRLLSFGNGREFCRKRMWETVRGAKVAVLNYQISPERIQMLTSGDSERNARLVTPVAAGTANRHRRRTGREGPFWKGRYRVSLVQNGAHLLRCSLAMDMTMVFQKKCLHPEEWPFSGYLEIVDIRKRYRVVGREKAAELCGFTDSSSMETWYLRNCRTDIKTMPKQEYPVAALAVGDLEHLENIARLFPEKSGKIEKLTGDGQLPTYALFLPKQTKRKFTRSLK